MDPEIRTKEGGHAMACGLGFCTAVSLLIAWTVALYAPQDWHKWYTPDLEMGLSLKLMIAAMSIQLVIVLLILKLGCHSSNPSSLNSSLKRQAYLTLILTYEYILNLES